MPLNEVIRVISVRNRFMSTIDAMLVIGFMPATSMRVGACIRICRRNFDCMLVNVTFVDVMHVAIMKIVDVASVFDLRMCAARAVIVRMILVHSVCHRAHYSAT